MISMRSALLLCVVSVVCIARADETSTVVSDGAGSGTIVHDVTSPYQAGTTKLVVLVPDNLDTKKTYPVVYVLPVGPDDMTGLSEMRRLGLHNQYQAIFVTPTFSDLPWYADNPSDRQIRQESYLLDVVIPYVDKNYPVRAERAGRFLLGFSKSGWGALALLLRHPELFERVAIWDAPLMMARPLHGSKPIFGTQENFEQYQLTRLIADRAEPVRSGNRMILMGYDKFGDEMRAAHALLDEHRVEHIFLDGPQRKHAWHTGWLPEAVSRLFAPDVAPSTK